VQYTLLFDIKKVEAWFKIELEQLNGTLL